MIAVQNPICPHNQLATFVCVDQKCTQPNPFFCNQSKDNFCKLKHKKCHSKKWKEFQLSLEQIKTTNEKLISPLTHLIQQCLLNSIKILEKQLDYFNAWKSSILQPSFKEQFLLNINQNQTANWNGKRIVSLLNSIQMKQNLKMSPSKKHNLSKSVEMKINQIKIMMRKYYRIENHQQHIISPFHSMKDFQYVIDQEIKIPSFEQIEGTHTILRLESYKLSDLNKKIMSIREKPKHLELKVIDIRIQCFLLLIQLYNKSNHRVPYQQFRSKLNINQEQKSNQLSLYSLFDLGVQNRQYQCNIYDIEESILLLNQGVIFFFIQNQNSTVKIQQFRVQNEQNYQLLTILQIRLYSKSYIRVYYRIYLVVCLCLYRVSIQQSRYGIMQSCIHQVSKVIKNQNLQQLTTLTLYYPYSLGKDQIYIKHEKMLCSSLASLSKLQYFTIIVNNLVSDEAFRNDKKLKSIFKCIKQEKWPLLEKW